eukprot:3464708-Prymnesium_polylepis.1
MASNTLRLITRRCALGTACPCLNSEASFNSPLIPAADSAWPELALTDPICSACPAAAAASGLSMTPAMEPASMGSPSAVPVPWASKSAVSREASPASLSVSWMSCCCARPFGAVRLGLFPSDRTRDPRT